MTALPSQNVAVTGNVYRQANPTVNTGSVSLAARVGGSASAAIGITNTSPDIYIEGLPASLGTASTGFNPSDSVTNLAAGATNGGSLTVGLNTATSGTFSGTQQINFTSTAANLATGPADLLDGLFSTLSGSGFATSGLTSFSGLMAQQQYAELTLSFHASDVGSLMETIDLMGTGSTNSGYSGRVADTLLTIEGVVVAAAGGGGTSVPEPGSLAVLASALVGLLAGRRRNV